MMRKLLSPSTALSYLAEFLHEYREDRMSLFVCEDQFFKEGRGLAIAELVVKPDPELDGASGFQNAIAHGFYEISTFELSKIGESLIDCLRHETEANGDKKKQEARSARVEKQNSKALKSLHFLPSIFSRVGLSHPLIDIDTLSRLPFTSPATVVVDTSAILNGGLDFVNRFLYPHARVKVPGIVSMEIVNSVDGYFYHRRQETSRPGDALLSHLKGIGGQRVLLRLELRDELELERTAIFHEPLRHAFKKDAEVDANVEVTAIVRSYADRLVLESARQHQAQVSPGHPIYLMTADQGLSRMALAEGFTPIFCGQPEVKEFFPLVMSGVNFAPFTPKLYGVPLTSLIWELAVCFGSAGLRAESGAFIDVAALGRDLPWQPFHSHEDLLWVESAANDSEQAARFSLAAYKNGGGIETAADPIGDAEGPARSLPASSHNRTRPRSTSTFDPSSAVEVDERAGSAFYKFSAGGLLKIIALLAERGELDMRRAAELVSVKESQARNYYGFLRAGGFIKIDGSSIRKSEALDVLYRSMRARDTRQTEELLSQVPSFKIFIQELDRQRLIAGEDLRQSVFWRLPNYRRYGEAVARMLLIPDEGLYATPKVPTVEEFAGLAVEAHSAVGGLASGYVLTGAWLEELVRSHGVHPIVARDRLSQAEGARLLNRFTRGATPDTRFENHEFHMIEPMGGTIDLVPVALYHGSFLIPERTSVELRIEGLRQ